MQATANNLDDIAVLHNDMDAIIADLEGDGIQLTQMTTDIELQEFIQIRPAEAAVLENTCTMNNPTTTPLSAVKAHISPSESLNQMKHVIERTKKTTTKQPNSQTGINAVKASIMPMKSDIQNTERQLAVEMHKNQKLRELLLQDEEFLKQLDEDRKRIREQKNIRKRHNMDDAMKRVNNLKEMAQRKRGKLLEEK
ncbi:unnamed protein product [Acanthoscelides obtectus]|uniref:Uncharacterized protein n=1 Tax=Acanthoscelides obtectus TaxID=200917 RepID=A0A9P0MCS6_ACAOB|nr:unnamed protein product [Acanthoscelides obtectus]CAK1624161.1 hypothetical protein AOBTE_LOCUS2362 [Acanthoscelides obtectus]